MTTKQEKALRDVLADFDSAMLVTRDPDGHPRARPMAIADRSKEGDLWFVTGAEPGKMTELRRSCALERSPNRAPAARATASRSERAR